MNRPTTKKENRMQPGPTPQLESAEISIDDASDDSFPASDAPPWTSGPSNAVVPPPPPPEALSAPVRLPGLPPPVAPQEPRPAQASAERKSAATPAGVRGTVKKRAALWQADPVLLARVQGWYFVATGLWPLVHLRSFERVTGGKRKNERWLVKTVGVLAASIGASLLSSTRRGRRPEGATKVLGTTSALGFLAIDAWYVAKGQLSSVYLADAVSEAVLAGGWLTVRD